MHQNIKHFNAVKFCIHDCQIYPLHKTSLLLISKMLISFWGDLMRFYSHWVLKFLKGQFDNSTFYEKSRKSKRLKNSFSLPP